MADAVNSAPPSQDSPAGGVDLRWVWREVRKRVFIKLPFSLGVADAMEAVEPIALDGDTFVCGLAPRHYPLVSHLSGEQVRNTIENILSQASGRPIHLEVIEGSTLEDWKGIKERRSRAQDAVIAMAEQKNEVHHFDDLLNQIVGELRQRIAVARDRALPQVRAQMLLDIAPTLADTEDMLFSDRHNHEARRAMARTYDRIASFMDVPAVVLALEVERHHLTQEPRRAPSLASASQGAAQLNIAPESQAAPSQAPSQAPPDA